MSNTFVTPKAVTTIAQSRINYNDSITSLLDNFASSGAPGPTNISLEGTSGLRTGMLWYKSGSDTSDGQGRLLVYNGSEFTRNGLVTYKMPGVSEANAAVVAGSISYGELVVTGTDSLFMVNVANTGVVPLNVGSASNAELLDGLDSTQFLRSDTADTMTGKLSITNNLSVSQNIGIGVTNPSTALDIEKDVVVVTMNDTNGSLGGSMNSYLILEATGTTHGEIGYVNTTDGELRVRNRQGNVIISADTNNSKGSSEITLSVDNATKMQITSTGASVTGDFTATGNINTSSDARLKSNVTAITSALDTVLSLQGVSFTMTSTQTNNIGLIAQEVEQILPDLVSNDGEYKAVSYQNIVALLIEAIKEQQQQIMRLQSGQ